MFDYVGVCILIAEAITAVVLKKIINLPAPRCQYNPVAYTLQLTTAETTTKNSAL